MASPAFVESIYGLCPDAFLPALRYHLGGHSGIGKLEDWERVGHGLVMLRQPEQRLISSFNDNQHDWAPELPPARSLLDYAQAVAGCSVKMLTRGGQNVCLNHTAPLDSEVTEAVSRLETDFPFVGLTEEWDLSVCLFHAMFGGVASASGLAMRGKSGPGLYDTSALEGFTDPYDGKVFEAATRLFEGNVRIYGLSEESCAPFLGR